MKPNAFLFLLSVSPFVVACSIYSGLSHASTVPIDTASSSVSSEDTEPGLLKIQQRLRSLNYPTGTPDGVKGAATTKAVRMFQAEMGFPSTGALDSRTVNALMGKDAKKLSALGVSGAFGIPAKQLRSFCKSVQTLGDKSRCMAAASVTVFGFGKYVNDMARLSATTLVAPFACDLRRFDTAVAKYISNSRHDADRQRFLSLGRDCDLYLSLIHI